MSATEPNPAMPPVESDRAYTGYFLRTQNDPRVRRARDAVQVVLGVILILVAAVESIRLSSLQEAFNSVLKTLPGWTESLFWVGYSAAGVYAAALVVLVVVRARRNPKATRDVLLAVAGGVVLALLAARWREGLWPELLPEFAARDPEPAFPIVRVAVVAAAVLALSPHVTRTLRRFGGSMMVLVIVAGFGLEFGYLSDAMAALGVGMVAAGVVFLVFGSPGGFPDPAVVANALAQLGVPVRDLVPTPDQSWGTRRLIGYGNDGVEIEVKAYGRDAVDTQRVGKIWRSLWYRDTGPALPLTRMQAVEHEALMAMFASRAGVTIAEPLTAGLAGDDVAILAIRRPGPTLADVAIDEISDRKLVAIWRDLALLHSADMAHGSPRAEAILLTEDGHLYDDFVAGVLAAGDRTHLDVVNLLFSLSTLVGVDRAVSTASLGLGNERLTASLPYLQLPALHRSVRRELEKPKGLMKELKAAVTTATGVAPAEEVKLRRVSVGSLLMAVLLVVAANTLISQLGGIDFAAVWEIVQDATAVGLLLAYVVAHLSFFPEGMGMIAAVGKPLPLQPIVILQLSARFIGLAVPSAAGRVAMNSAFLVKFGISTTKAVVQGAIDGVSGFVVEAAILLVALLFYDDPFALGGDTNWQAILLVAVGVVAVGVIVLVYVERLRRVVVPVLKDALESVSSVLRDPRRTMTLLTSNFLSRFALALALWLILRAIGIDLSVVVVLVVAVATNLLAGLVPIPGGIGIAEAVMASWLVLVGVPEEAAFAATVVYRMFTFYLPAVEGFFAMRWLEAHDYL